MQWDKKKKKKGVTMEVRKKWSHNGGKTETGTRTKVRQTLESQWP